MSQTKLIFTNPNTIRLFGFFYFNFCSFFVQQQVQLFDPEMTDSSSQSDDTSGCGGTTTTRTSRTRSATNSRRRKGQLNAKERNIRRLESNERERMRMHSLNDAFQVLLQLKLNEEFFSKNTAVGFIRITIIGTLQDFFLLSTLPFLHCIFFFFFSKLHKYFPRR